MDAYAAHLAMAALVGASIVALSAYFMHRKTLSQVLEFARYERDRDRRRGKPRGPPLDEEEEYDDDDADEVPLPNHYKRRSHQNHLPSRRKAAAAEYYSRGSASVPEVMTAAGEEDEREEEEDVVVRRAVMNGPFSAVGGAAPAAVDQQSLAIPPGLPRLHTFPEGTYESEHMMSDFSPH